MCHFNGVAADLHIKTVSEESLELDTQEPSLGKKGAVLLDYGGKVLRGITAGRLPPTYWFPTLNRTRFSPLS